MAKKDKSFRKGSPEISVIIVAERFSQIRKTVRHLLAQTIHSQLELVIAAPSRGDLAIDEKDLEAFADVQILEVGSISILAHIRALAIQKAQAPIIVLAEGHSFPQPTWAEALLAAHHQGWPAVGPAVVNANPQSLTSWACFFLDYGQWSPPLPSSTLDDLPGHNSSYKREVLLQYGPELGSLLEMETILHWDLHRKGLLLYLEPKAVTQHINVSRFPSWVLERFNSGRRFASARSRRWALWRRLLYALGSPLIPIIRMRRTLPNIYRTGKNRELMPKILPILIASLVVSAAGEMFGYLLGPGSAMYILSRIELDKTPYLRPEEQGITGV